MQNFALDSNKTATRQPPTTAELITLDDWLNYMYGIHVSAIDMGLERVLPVFEKLGIDKGNAYIFTVAGTNGKGSTTATIAQICEQAGYKTALYQSPHLLVFNERVKINGQMATDSELIAAFNQVEAARLACDLTLSFFEMTTLAALLIFQQAGCEVWVLEIGLGGRLDVVNVIDPDLAVITNIGIDHVDWLGDTREKIGLEKAGILREGIVLVYGESDMPATILPIIKDKHVTLLQYGEDYAYFSDLPVENAGKAATVTSVWYYSNPAVTLSLPMPSLAIHNVATAITAVLASELPITLTIITAALPKVTLAGRFDKRPIAKRTWLFDVAHNSHGIAFLLQQFAHVWQPYQAQFPHARLHLLFSMLADKDINSVMTALTTLPFTSVHSGSIEHPRAADVAMLKTALSQHFSNDFYLFPSLADATDSVIEHSQVDDMILVCGSFYTIAGVLEHLSVKNS